MLYKRYLSHYVSEHVKVVTEKMIEIKSYSLLTRLPNLKLESPCQQGGLLQLGSRWYSRPAAGPAAVRLECRRPFGLLNEAVRTHNPIAS